MQCYLVTTVQRYIDCTVAKDSTVVNAVSNIINNLAVLLISTIYHCIVVAVSDTCMKMFTVSVHGSIVNYFVFKERNLALPQSVTIDLVKPV